MAGGVARIPWGARRRGGRRRRLRRRRGGRRRVLRREKVRVHIDVTTALRVVHEAGEWRRR